MVFFQTALLAVTATRMFWDDGCPLRAAPRAVASAADRRDRDDAADRYCYRRMGRAAIQRHRAVAVRPVSAVSIGLPFFTLSASAPLLQSWFAASGHPQAKNPYVLYAASNLGSFAALFAYPVVIEPWLTLSMQTRIWSAGFRDPGDFGRRRRIVRRRYRFWGPRRGSGRRMMSRPVSATGCAGLCWPGSRPAFVVAVTAHITTERRGGAVPCGWSRSRSIC